MSSVCRSFLVKPVLLSNMNNWIPKDLELFFKKYRQRLVPLGLVFVLSLVLLIQLMEVRASKLEDVVGSEVSNNPAAQNQAIADQVEGWLQEMTLEEKVAQLFVIRPEALTGEEVSVSAGELIETMYDQYPVAGLIYFSKNLQTKEQVKEMLLTTQQIAKERSGLPAFISIDEEGGDVTRIGGNPEFGVPEIRTMTEIGQTGAFSEAVKTGEILGQYLSELGFNVDYAPVADVITNPQNTVIGERSFGTDCNLVAQMVVGELEGLQHYHVIGVAKHFPGHGATSDDTHFGDAVTQTKLEDMMNNEIIPFQTAIKNQVEMIMVGHFSAPNVTEDNLPCSLSSIIVSDLLRKRLDFEGVIITDALDMGAITQAYDARTAAIMAIDAGNDLVLMPEDFQLAYFGVLDAVKTGRISETRIDESVRRIIRLKLKMSAE